MKSQFIYKNIIILIQAKRVYLYNKLSEPIDSLIYETFSMVTTDDNIGVSDSPSYEILNIPANSAVFLEQLDGWEDGRIYYNLLKLKTKEIEFNDKIELKSKPLSGMVRLPKIAAIEKTKLETGTGFIVDIEKTEDKIINDLYWLAEDLVAYTDLASERFDIDNAKMRLWKMNKSISKIDAPKLINWYNQLEEQLENPTFFDKIEFSNILQLLFTELENLKNP